MELSPKMSMFLSLYHGTGLTERLRQNVEVCSRAMTDSPAMRTSAVDVVPFAQVTSTRPSPMVLASFNSLSRSGLPPSQVRAGKYVRVLWFSGRLMTGRLRTGTTVAPPPAARFVGKGAEKRVFHYPSWSCRVGNHLQTNPSTLDIALWPRFDLLTDKLNRFSEVYRSKYVHGRTVKHDPRAAVIVAFGGPQSLMNRDLGADVGESDGENKARDARVHDEHLDAHAEGRAGV